MTSDDQRIQGGGGITRGSAGGRDARDTSELPELMRAFRQCWASGVAVLTTGNEGRYRGITLTAVLPVSLEPPLVAVAVTADGEFAERLREGQRCALSILDRSQVFLSERFAGRAPLPDPAFTGIPFDPDSHGVPIIRNAVAAVSCQVKSLVPAGDHVVVMLEVTGGFIGDDTSDPLVSFESAYRGLELE